MENENRIDRSWMPPVAGILDVVAGVFGLIGCGALVFASTIIGHVAAEEQEFPLFAVEGLLVAVAIGIVVLAVLALVGGFFALRRSSWAWMIVGAIAATVLCPPLGVPSIILTVLSEKELGA